MNHHCACLASIAESLLERCLAMEAYLGAPRAARLVCLLSQGEAAIERVLRCWVEGVAAEHTRDPDVLGAVRILLDIFAVEVRELAMADYCTLRAFGLWWIRRCIRRLRAGIVVGELVFVGENGVVGCV